jgi:hypothetical protein
LSPEDNDPPQLGWLATSLRRGGQATFHEERNAVFLDHQLISNQQVRQHIQPNPMRRNVGKTMLLPVIIFLMILFPVLLPATITAVDAVARTYRKDRTASHPRSLASRRLLVPAAA